MKNYVTKLLLSAIALLLLSSAISAQTLAPAPEKFPVRLIPRPNTTSQLHMIQDVEMEVTFENAPADAPSLPPMKMQIKSTIEMTQKNGAPGKRGELEAEVIPHRLYSPMNISSCAARVRRSRSAPRK